MSKRKGRVTRERDLSEAAQPELDIEPDPIIIRVHLAPPGCPRGLEGKRMSNAISRLPRTEGALFDVDARMEGPPCSKPLKVRVVATFVNPSWGYESFVTNLSRKNYSAEDVARSSLEAFGKGDRPSRWSRWFRRAGRSEQD